MTTPLLTPFTPSASPRLHGCACHRTPLRAEAAAPAPSPASDGVAFSFNPQDRRVLDAAPLKLNGVTLGSRNNPETARVSLNEGLEPVDGAYVYGSDDVRQPTAIAFANVARTVEIFGKVFGDTPWAFPYDKLAVNANGGKDFNAFYARKNGTVNFFAETDPIVGSLVHSGASGEVVAHEVGHALLDGIRPEYLGSWKTDVGAFHEAFGDMLAMHMSLLDERVARRVIVQTGGDLSKPNISAQVAEELGTGINNKKGRDTTGGDYLRTFLNPFTWADPKTLPEKGGPTALGREIHDFSRLWSGAHYDLLKNLVDERRAAGVAPLQALQESNQELLEMLARLIKEAPRGEFTYKDMATTMIQSDKLHNDGKRADMIQKVFTNRKILPENLNPAALEPARRATFGPGDEPVRQLNLQLSDACGMYAGAKVQVPVAADRALFASDSIHEDTEEEIRSLAATGKIRYNDPTYQMKYPQDYFNPQGEPFIGFVRWENGEMHLERSTIAI